MKTIRQTLKLALISIALLTLSCKKEEPPKPEAYTTKAVEYRLKTYGINTSGTAKYYGYISSMDTEKPIVAGQSDYTEVHYFYKPGYAGMQVSLTGTGTISAVAEIYINGIKTYEKTETGNGSLFLIFGGSVY